LSDVLKRRLPKLGKDIKTMKSFGKSMVMMYVQDVELYADHIAMIDSVDPNINQHAKNFYKRHHVIGQLVTVIWPTLIIMLIWAAVITGEEHRWGWMIFDILGACLDYGLLRSNYRIWLDLGPPEKK
jgi:hypothetical protein